MTTTHQAPFDVHGALKPKLRGLVHAWSVIPMAIAGIILIVFANPARARVGAVIYAVAVTGMLTASACYHRLKVSESKRIWLRRLDHSMIGVAVAGTYTPVILLTVSGALMIVLLALIWLGAIGAMAVSFLAPHAPSWLRATIYLVLGFAGVAITPWIFQKAGVAAFVLVCVGAFLYILGALAYASQRPNPWPGVFGFHEVFHTLVVAAAGSHFAAVAVVIAQRS